MCGITGCIVFDQEIGRLKSWVEKSNLALERRGPDGGGFYFKDSIGLGHRRLAIIDTSDAAAQPISDASGRFTMVFNGEIFNFQEHREQLVKEGVKLKSQGDSEVLLHLFMRLGPACLQQLNGFFAFAIYDAFNKELFVARDRYGIKPLYYCMQSGFLAFASTLEALEAYPVVKAINQQQLFSYLQLNYLPFQQSIYEGVYKVKPGSYLHVKNGHLKTVDYYEVPRPEKKSYQTIDYQTSKHKLKKLLTEAVERRLVADVPLGCFLSGGIDSSIITAVAAKLKPDLKTFSIGYKDEPFFDETHYAQLVAKMHKTDHTVFSLSNADLLSHFLNFLDGLDEPFADSSALAVYILSKETRKEVTVALSGDGADELFAGYNKHAAERLLRNGRFLRPFLKASRPFLQLLPQSRNSKLTNQFRQLQKLADGAKLSDQERYWRWASYCTEAEAKALLKANFEYAPYLKNKKALLQTIDKDFNSTLRADVALVLEGDMLVKADRMSMANSLEVRVPFLDVNVVDYAFEIPAEFKISRSDRKIILKDAFKEDLPEQLLSRGKKGFEVPLLKWLTTDLKDLLVNDLLSKDFIENQNLFNYSAVKVVLDQLFSNNPGDASARDWGLLIFQAWYKKHLLNEKICLK